MISENQTFKNKRIHLDGSSFTECVFENCTIIFSGLMGVELVKPQFTECRFEVQGNAKETMRFLASLYKAGTTQLVEDTFDAIRGKNPKGTTLQ